MEGDCPFCDDMFEAKKNCVTGKRGSKTPNLRDVIFGCSYLPVKRDCAQSEIL